MLWSGIRSLVIAGSDPAMMTITGFDEGLMPEHWQGNWLIGELS